MANFRGLPDTDQVNPSFLGLSRSFFPKMKTGVTRGLRSLGIGDGIEMPILPPSRMGYAGREAADHLEDWMTEVRKVGIPLYWKRVRGLRNLVPAVHELLEGDIQNPYDSTVQGLNTEGLAVAHTKFIKSLSHPEIAAMPPQDQAHLTSSVYYHLTSCGVVSVAVASSLKGEREGHVVMFSDDAIVVPKLDFSADGQNKFGSTFGRMRPRRANHIFPQRISQMGMLVGTYESLLVMAVPSGARLPFLDEEIAAPDMKLTPMHQFHELDPSMMSILRSNSSQYVPNLRPTLTREQLVRFGQMPVAYELEPGEYAISQALGLIVAIDDYEVHRANATEIFYAPNGEGFRGKPAFTNAKYRIAVASDDSAVEIARSAGLDQIAPLRQSELNLDGAAMFRDPGMQIG